ncbi:MAG: molybdenum cofactor biosynthesis protein MoaE [Chloroflexi bacterium]|nr:molybdenum cofactor biosynthesis protein MoaE [Chloroflexota bacterium]
MGRWIVDSPLELEPLLRETEDPGSGALVIFYGTVRNENEGRPVQAMTYEAHVALAEKTLNEIEAETLEKFGVRRCRIQHRIGTLQLGEPSVLIVVRGGHRTEAYAASRYAIDEVKQRAAIWKEEHYADGDSRYLDGVPLTRKDETPA